MRTAGRIYRPRILAAIFGSYFAVVMGLSWTFSSTLPGPRYQPDISRWVYMTFVLASSVFLMGVGIFAFHIQNALENRVREVNRELGGLVWEGSPAFPAVEALPATSDGGEEGGEESDDPTAPSLDEILEVLGEAQAETAQEVLVESADSTVEEADPVEAAREIMLRRDLVRRREGLKRHQDYLLTFLPGPLTLAVGILGVSMAMLPASDGMLQSSFQLNTALIRGFAYGWFGLAAYFGASILGVVASLRSERKRRIPRAEK